MAARAVAAKRADADAALALPEPGELLGLAERVLGRATARGAEAADVFVQSGRSLVVSVERSALEGGEAGGGLGLGVRVQHAGKVGFGYASDERGAVKAIEAALQASKHARREALLLAEPEAAPTPPPHDPRIVALEVEELASRAHQVVEAARAVHPEVEVTAGGVGASSEVWALATSRGVRHEEANAGVSAFASVVVKGATLSTGSHQALRRADDIDHDEVGRKAAELALAGRKPRKADSGAYTLLLKPEALQELLEFCCVTGLLGDNLRRKLSPFTGKLGKKVAAPGFSLSDDGLLPGGLGSGARDDEGLPSRRTPLIARGVMVGALHDLRSAKQVGGKATGCALRSERGDGERSHHALPRATGRNLVVEGPSRPLEALVAEVQRGFVVHDVIGAHTANSTTGEFHVNSALLFRIEEGEVVGPAKSVMLSGAMLDWLQKVSGLSTETTDLDGYLAPASLRLPWMRVDGATVHA